MSLNRFLGFMSSPITIDVHPELCRFSSGTENLQLETYINIQMIDGKYRFHSAGEDASAVQNTVRIDLFRNSELPFGANRMEALEAFLRHGIQSLSKSKKSRLIRPVITVRNIQSLDEVLLGYQQSIMRPVLLESGAREVRFE